MEEICSCRELEKQAGAEQPSVQSGAVQQPVCVSEGFTVPSRALKTQQLRVRIQGIQNNVLGAFDLLPEVGSGRALFWAEICFVEVSARSGADVPAVLPSPDPDPTRQLRLLLSQSSGKEAEGCCLQCC